MEPRQVKEYKASEMGFCITNEKVMSIFFAILLGVKDTKVYELCELGIKESG